MRKEFRTGNVVKLKSGLIVIIIDVEDETTSWVDAGAENVSGVTRNRTYKEKEMCFCKDNFGGVPDESCEDCHGKGEFLKTYDGMDKAILLAESVNDFIEKGLKRFLKYWD